MSTVLEIGPGRGDFLFQLASADPASRFVAVEIKRKRHEKLLARVERLKLTNVELHLGNAVEVLPKDFEPEAFDQIYILFSDPWPKRRHARHRLFQTAFARELHRILRPEGRVFIAHDDPVYIDQIRSIFRTLTPYFVPDMEDIDFKTFYASKWEKAGRRLESFSYRRITPSDRDDPALPCVPPGLLEESLR